MFCSLRLPALLAAASFCLPTATHAQSSLGVAGFVTDIGRHDSDLFALAQLDTAITEVHGLQLDLSYVDYELGGVGQLAAHFYMTPIDGQKYGVFFTLGDGDDRSRTYGSLGLEGIFSVMPNTVLSVGGGLGVADPDSWDFVYLDAGLSHGLGKDFRIDYGLTLTEIDEPGLSDVGSEARVSLRYDAPGAIWGAFAEARYDDINDDDDITLRAGITISLGRGNGFAPKDRMFRTAEPLGPLFRRGRL